MVFTGIPSGYDLKKIYTEGYFCGKQTDGYAGYRESEKVLRKEFEKSVRMIRKWTGYRQDMKLKLLEVGSAYGYFLDEAEKYFECYGVEVCMEAVEYAIQRGHRVFCGEVNEEFLKKTGPVDIVVMLDVIEHLPNPIESLSLLDKYLNPGGLFLIVTGDIDSIPAKVMKKRWRLMTPPQHTCFFSKRILVDLFREYKYEIIRTDRPWKFVPLGLVFYQIERRLGFGIKWFEKISHTGIYLNLFDTIRIAARKK